MSRYFILFIYYYSVRKQMMLRFNMFHKILFLLFIYFKCIMGMSIDSLRNVYLLLTSLYKKSFLVKRIVNISYFRAIFLAHASISSWLYSQRLYLYIKVYGEDWSCIVVRNIYNNIVYTAKSKVNSQSFVCPSHFSIIIVLISMLLAAACQWKSTIESENVLK
jgi:hypothetical protein